jgi:hypothetical protein
MKIKKLIRNKPLKSNSNMIGGFGNWKNNSSDSISCLIQKMTSMSRAVLTRVTRSIDDAKEPKRKRQQLPAHVVSTQASAAL